MKPRSRQLSSHRSVWYGLQSGLTTVLDEDVLEPAEAYDLIDDAREGLSIPLDIDA